MTTPQIPDWVLERYHLGELTGPRKQQVDAALAQDPSVQARLDALAASDAEILAAFPPRVVAASVAARSVAQRRSPVRWAVPAMALAAALLVAPLVLYPTGPGDSTGNYVGIKGGDTALRVFFDQGSGAGELHSGDRVSPGDTVQLAYVGGSASFGAIVSIDGRGTVTRHWPRRGTEAAALEDAPTVALPTALRLDDAPKFERFFFVTSSEPFQVATVIDAAEQLADHGDPVTDDLGLSNVLAQSDFLLRKDNKP